MTSKDNNKTTYVYDALRKGIIDGSYQGGTFLVENNICESLGVSRTPVREAIIRLSNDGFVEIIPNRGAFIPHIALKDIIDLYQIRMACDGMAALLCVRNQSINLIADLAASVAREELLIQQVNPDPKALSEEELYFHSQIVSRCGNSKLGGEVEQLGGLMERILKQAADQYSLDNIKKSLEYHKEFITAFHNNDEEKAREIMEQHWQTALDGYISRDLAGTLPRAL